MAFTASYIYEILDRYSKPLKRITAATEQFTEKVDRASARAQKLGGGLKDVGAKLTTRLTLPLLGAGALAAKTAIDFQDAFIGVRKTVDATEPQLMKMRQQFLKMSTEIPVSATELMKIGESAGQLGIQTKNITSFTRTIAMLGATTNLTGEEGATQLARFANITQMSQENFDRLGSTIVHLGNNLATTEAEIVAMGLRLAGAGNVVGLTEPQIMAMSGTLTSLGINAEAGGTAFSKVMMSINDAVSKGGPMLNAFAQVAGMNAKQMAESFKKDASKGILAFVEGLGKMRAEGKNVNAVLEALEFNDIRVKDALLRASGSGELFRKSMIMAAKAWKENIALTREAELRFKSWSSQLKMAWARIKIFANSIGEILVPMFVDFIRLMQPVLDFFIKLSPGIKKIIVIIGALVAVIGPLLMIAGALAVAIGFITWPVVAVGAAIAAVIAMVSAQIAVFSAMLNKSADFRQSLTNLYEAFQPLLKIIKDFVFWVGNGLSAAFGGSGDEIKAWGDLIAKVINAVAYVVRAISEEIAATVDNFRMLFSGNFSGILEASGIGGLLEKVGLRSAKEKTAARQDNKVEVSGQIGVSASGGAKVEKAEIGLNQGYNLAVAR